MKHRGIAFLSALLLSCLGIPVLAEDPLKSFSMGTQVLGDNASDVEVAVAKLIGKKLKVGATTTYFHKEGDLVGVFPFMVSKGILQSKTSQPAAFAAQRAEVLRVENYCATEGDLTRDGLLCFNFSVSKQKGTPNGSKNWNTFETSFTPVEDVKFDFEKNPESDKQHFLSYGIVSDIKIFDGEEIDVSSCDEHASVRIWFDNPTMIASALMEYSQRDHLVATICYQVTREGLTVKWVDIPEL